MWKTERWFYALIPGSPRILGNFVQGNIMKIIQIICLLVLCSVTQSCGNSNPNEDLAPYVLPPKDSELVYSLLDGGQMITRVLSFDDGEAQMKDVMDIPKNMQLPEGVKWSDFGVKDRKVTYHYSYIFKKGHVLRRDKRDESILLKSPLSPFASGWEFKMQNFGEGKKVEFFGECQIVERKRQRVLDEERPTLTLDCVGKTLDKGKILFQHRFAKGVGIIEKSMYYIEDFSVKVDSTPPVDLIQLIEIRPTAT